MATHHIPKGVSFDTLTDVIAGWDAVGAAAEPKHTADVEEATGISDAVGRQSRFLEELGVLAEEGQKHRLTDRGQALAGALAVGDDVRAKGRARDLLADWPVTEELRGVVRDNPTDQEALVPLLAAVTGQDAADERVRNGLTTLLDLFEWADLLARDDDGRYRLPEADRAGADEQGSTAGRPATTAESTATAALERVAAEAERAAERAADAEASAAASADEIEAAAERVHDRLDAVADRADTAESTVDETAESADEVADRVEALEDAVEAAADELDAVTEQARELGATAGEPAAEAEERPESEPEPTPESPTERGAVPGGEAVEPSGVPPTEADSRPAAESERAESPEAVEPAEAPEPASVETGETESVVEATEPGEPEPAGRRDGVEQVGVIDGDADAETAGGDESGREAADGSQPAVEFELGDGTGVSIGAADGGIEITVDGDVDLADLRSRDDVTLHGIPDAVTDIDADDLRTDGGTDGVDGDDDVRVSEAGDAVTIEIDAGPGITVSVSDESGGESGTESPDEEVAAESGDGSETAEEHGAAEEAETDEESGDAAAERAEEGAAEPTEESATEEADEQGTEAGEADEQQDGAEERLDTDAAIDVGDAGEVSASDVASLVAEIEAAAQDAMDAAEDAEEAATVAQQAVEAVDGTAAQSEADGAAPNGDADGHALSLGVDLDADPEDLEVLVRGIRRGLTEETGESAGGAESE